MNAIVFGASGSVGSAIMSRLGTDGFSVVGTARQPQDDLVGVDPSGDAGVAGLDGLGPFDAAVWAQGSYVNDSVFDVDLDQQQGMLQANVLYVTATLRRLLDAGGLRDGARLCVISSIWQEIARQHKLSYSISKAAIGGLVRSAAADLGERGMLVNAVLPGALDTPMTRSMLTPEQLVALEQATGFRRLVTLDDVAGVVAFLVSPTNTAITGQSITIDLGFSDVRLV